jgi:hypothetical protein
VQQGIEATAQISVKSNEKTLQEKFQIYSIKEPIIDLRFDVPIKMIPGKDYDIFAEFDLCGRLYKSGVLNSERHHIIMLISVN